MLYVANPEWGLREFIEAWHRAERGERTVPVKRLGFERVEDLCAALEREEGE
ncbi:MAG: hypothetical protein J5I92_15605 [Thiogranum sp.]|nr:hypothetical protein [Thiogranum sp.]